MTQKKRALGCIMIIAATFLAVCSRNGASGLMLLVIFGLGLLGSVLAALD